ncbi:hypothetical protein [Ekhidna sp.]
MNKILKTILKWFIIGIFILSFMIYSFIKADEAEKRAEEIGRITLELK